MKQKQLSAKDRAFEKERVAFRKALKEKDCQCLKLQSRCKDQEEELAGLKTALAEKEDHIERLLEFMDLSPEEWEQLRKQASQTESMDQALAPLKDMLLGMFHNRPFL